MTVIWVPKSTKELCSITVPWAWCVSSTGWLH